MKRLILGILVAVFIFSVVGNCFAALADEVRKPKPKTKSTYPVGG